MVIFHSKLLVYQRVRAGLLLISDMFFSNKRVLIRKVVWDVWGSRHYWSRFVTSDSNVVLLMFSTANNFYSLCSVLYNVLFASISMLCILLLSLLLLLCVSIWLDLCVFHLLEMICCKTLCLLDIRLVGGLEHFLIFHILETIIPTD